METKTLQRWGFLLLSLVLLIPAVTWRPAVYGNDEASIVRYLYQEKAWGDRIRVLAVKDLGEDRFAVFRLETKRPDDRYIVRFRQNETGDYEADGYLGQIYGPYPARGIYSQPLSRDGAWISYAVWSETEALAEIRFQPKSGPEASVPLPAAPALTVCRFRSSGSWSTAYYDDLGNEL